MWTSRIVTKDSDDGSFQSGDHIVIRDDGTVFNYNAGGCLDEMEAETAMIGMESSPVAELISKAKASLLESTSDIAKVGAKKQDNAESAGGAMIEVRCYCGRLERIHRLMSIKDMVCLLCGAVGRWTPEKQVKGGSRYDSK